MSLNESFYMDKELGLNLKDPISKVDLTSIDLCLLTLQVNSLAYDRPLFIFYLYCTLKC